jgi:hypothetical protein
MGTDILRLFRKCFLCSGKQNLLRVEYRKHPAYGKTFSYYHQDCLDLVMRTLKGTPFKKNDSNDKSKNVESKNNKFKEIFRN